MYQQVILIGYLGNDPEMRETTTGTPFASFRLAVSRRWTTTEGQTQEKTNWFHVTAWRRQAELAKEYLAKGQQVMIVGEIDGSRVYKDREGNQRATIDVTVRDLRFMGTRRDDQDVAAMSSSEQPEAADTRVPF